VRTVQAMSNDLDFDTDGGLVQDMPRLLQRRAMLKMLAGGALLALAACGDDDDSASTTAVGSTTGAGSTNGSPDGSTTGSTTGTTGSTTASPAATSTTDVEEIPEETAGPYPGDGSNGPNVLTQSGVVRGDIRTSLGSSEVVPGTALTVELTIADAATNVAMPGAAVYLWHCDAEGRYSMYSNGVTEETWLRGVQEADANGKLSFTTIYPACYSGRWPHIHFEVYASLDEATAAGEPVATSQLALPDSTNSQVFALDVYASSLRTYPQVSLSGDNVFGEDDGALQTPTMSGAVESGFTAALTVGI
jgi:protocatechuate 3,4-dioxygenase beta subunit